MTRPKRIHILVSRWGSVYIPWLEKVEVAARYSIQLKVIRKVKEGNHIVTVSVVLHDNLKLSSC